MSTNAGTLLWNRKRFSLQVGSTDIDTGLRQPQQAFGASSVGEPPLGIAGVAAPAPGSLPASRVQVIPLPPIDQWGTISISEPWVDVATGTVFVTFTNNGEEPISNVVALFWDPHTSIGPGKADTYNAIQGPQ